MELVGELSDTPAHGAAPWIGWAASWAIPALSFDAGQPEPSPADDEVLINDERQARLSGALSTVAATPR